MSLKVKEICKAKGMKMSDLAKKMGINPVNLSASLNGNPTIGYLQKIADILGVEVADLFNRQSQNVIGCVLVNNVPHIIRSREDLIELAGKI